MTAHAREGMTHTQGVLAMLVVTLMWSIAGVVTKRLDAAASFEVTFWRSAFNALALAVLLSMMRGPRRFVRSLTIGGWPLLASSVCWSVMFTAFMVALTMTTVANVLVTMALGPMFTALLARIVLHHVMPWRTWLAMAVAGVGIVCMVGEPVKSMDTMQLGGIAVALCVPVAAAVNWNVMQWLQEQRSDGSVDLMPAVFWGAVGSAAITLPLAWPLVASAHDVRWLALLGTFQLAVPCLLSVAVARVLKAPEMALLSLCEVIFGVAWAWMGAHETPRGAVVVGGALVLMALAFNEAWALRIINRQKKTA